MYTTNLDSLVSIYELGMMECEGNDIRLIKTRLKEITKPPPYPPGLSHDPNIPKPPLFRHPFEGKKATA